MFRVLLTFVLVLHLKITFPAQDKEAASGAAVRGLTQIYLGGLTCSSALSPSVTPVFPHPSSWLTQRDVTSTQQKEQRRNRETDTESERETVSF